LDARVDEQVGREPLMQVVVLQVPGIAPQLGVPSLT
jgi:hypothetical protein